MLVTKNFEKEKVLVALSVRSAFDLYLQVRLSMAKHNRQGSILPDQRS